MGEPEASESAARESGSMPWWIGPASAAVGVFLLGILRRWPLVDGRWAVAVFAGVAADVSLLAAGSLSAAAYAIRKAADFRGFGSDEAGRPARPGSPKSGPCATGILGGRFRGATASLEKIPGRTRFALDQAVYWAGVAAAFVLFADHAAAAGWAASSAGLAAAGPFGRDSKIRPLVFVLAASAAAAASLAWVRPGASFTIAHAASATLVMAAGAGVTGASVVAMRWRVSERVSLPVAVALTVWSLTWFFVRGEGLGHEPSIVAWGVGVGAALAGTGFLVCALDGPGAGVVLFFVGRVYAFLNWAAAIPFLIATVIGWRPRLPWRRPVGRGLRSSGRRGEDASRHGAAFEITTGAVPFALAAGYFTLGSPVFLGAYAAYCSAAVAVRISRLAAGFRRARVALAAGAAVVVPAAPLVHRAAGYGFRVAGSAVVGALLALCLDLLLDARAEDWRGLPVPVRRAALGAVASGAAAALAALALAAGTAAR